MMKNNLLTLLMLLIGFSSFCQLTAPFTESFNSTSVPSTWNLKKTTGSDWRFGSVSDINGNSSLAIDDHSGIPGSTITWMDYSSTDEDVILESDTIDVSGLTVPELNFYINSKKNTTKGTLSPYSVVYIEAYNGSSWVYVDSIRQDHFGIWTEQIYVMTPYVFSGNKLLIRFRSGISGKDVSGGTGNDSWHDIALDDISVFEYYACRPVTNINSRNLTTTSATVAWTASGTDTAWIVEYGLAGFTPGTGTTVQVAVDTLNIIGLTELTNYEYYITGLCSTGDTSALLGPNNFTTPCASGLAGNYTIDPASPTAGTNFNSFNDFFVKLIGCGLDAATTVDVAAGTGPYIISADVPAIPGSSTTNTLTINGNGNTINHGGGSYFLALNGVSHLTINDFNFVNETPSNSMYGIMMRGGCNSITIKNNTINLGTGFTSSSSACIIATNSTTSATSVGDNVNDITIDSNILIGGETGIRINGSSQTVRGMGVVITNNTIEDFYKYSTYVRYMNYVIFDNNDVSRPSRTSLTVFQGVHTNWCSQVAISNNKFHNSGVTSSACYAINMQYCSNTLGNESYIVNNAIYDINVTGSFFGIHLYSTSSSTGKNEYINIWNNTITKNTSGTTGIVKGITTSSSSSSFANNINVTNNLIDIYGNAGTTKHGIYLPGMSNFTGGNNLVYMGATAGTNHFGYFGGTESSLSDWNTATGTTGNSDENPFMAPSSYTPLSAAADNGGTPLPMISSDIDGATRDAVTPDYGAVEFVGLAGDLSLTNTWLKEKEVCFGTTDTAFATIKNDFGTTVDFSTDNLVVNWTVAGPLNTTGTTTISTGTLAVGAEVTVSIATVDMSLPGMYVVSANIETNSINASASNDTLLDYYTFEKKAMITVTPKSDTVIVTTSDSVHLLAESQFFTTGGFFITEVCQYTTTSTGRPSAGTPTWLDANDYIEITGVPNSDLEGYTIEIWNTATLDDSYTFPAGTVLGPNGTATISTYQGSVPSPANFYYIGPSESKNSTTASGRILKDENGNIVDAVAYQSSYSFPASSGITSSDWTGNGVDGNSSWGIRLTGDDLNNNTGWVKATQDPGTPNAGVTIPSPVVITGLQWTEVTNNVALDTTPEMYAKGWTASGLYKYEAAYSTPCGAQADTAEILVLIKTYDTTTVAACDSFTTPLGGVTYLVSGFYSDTIKGMVIPYDSIINVYDVTVNYQTTETIAVSICDSLQVPSGAWYSATGTYMDTIPNAAGCDSVMTINLTITTTTFSRDTVFACDSNDFRGTILTTAGTYYDTVFTGSCDSIYIRTLTMGYASYESFTHFVCDSFTSPTGKIWKTSGVFMDTIMNASGCDSVMTFNLTFGYISYSTYTGTHCDQYTSPSGKVWTTSGTYLDTIVNASGCDSAMTFNLTINYSKTATNVVTTCDSYTLPSGIVVNYTGSFTDTITTTLGCDSVVTTLLTINYTTSSTISEVACGTYTSPSGKVWTTSGTRFDTIPNATGCDSLMTINLTVKAVSAETRTITTCDSYTVPETGMTYYASGTYTDVTTNAFGCPHTITTVLTINSVNAGTITVSGTTLSSTATGVTYKWVDCNNNYSFLLKDTMSTYTPPRNGSYACWVTSSDGCSDTTACVSINTVSLDEYVISSSDVSIYPNPANDFVTIDILNQNIDEAVSIKLFDLKGQLVYSESATSTNNKVTFDVSDLAQGMYSVTISNEFFSISKKVNVVK